MRAEDVLEFWFGDGSTAIAEKKGLWFRASDELDAEIRARFGSAVEAALAGGFGEWLATARGRLALIILLDQFTRNIYRGSGVAFSGDLLAQRYCLDGLERGDDRSLSPYERVFFYLPLEHAEDLALQERSVALFENKYRLQRLLAANMEAGKR